MAALKTLSLARNVIRKIEGLEPVGGTLEQLWLSYNQLERLVRHGPQCQCFTNCPFTCQFDRLSDQLSDPLIVSRHTS